MEVAQYHNNHQRPNKCLSMTTSWMRSWNGSGNKWMVRGEQQFEFESLKKIRDRFTIRSYICIEYLATFSSKILETDVKMCPFYILIIFLCIYYSF